MSKFKVPVSMSKCQTKYDSSNYTVEMIVMKGVIHIISLQACCIISYCVVKYMNRVRDPLHKSSGLQVMQQHNS
jgi:hypothetical protein